MSNMAIVENAQQSLKQSSIGLSFDHYFSNSKIDPFDDIEWEKTTISIKDADGKIVFEQKDAEFPKSWSETARKIVANKYFKGAPGTSQRESSLKQVVNRVVDTVENWAVEGGYMSISTAKIFAAELKWLLVQQHAAFNSPVWFNVGTDAASAGWVWDEVLQGVRKVDKNEHRPQCSACFIISVEDEMESILDWVKTEGHIFKFGSGAGTNLSKIRSSKELLSGGGVPSGPLPFMRTADQNAGSIKSGGKHRRAAKMVILNSDHPDIEDFIACKSQEEEAAHKLIAAGYDGGFNVAGGAYDRVFYQNANHSVSANDKFMWAVVSKKVYDLKAITTGDSLKTVNANEMMTKIAEATWKCGDPGMQFRDTMNCWNVVSDQEEIRASNPCSEYIFLDDTACNLSSLNLMKFREDDGIFNVERFKRAVDIMITAQEILVDNSSYPTAKIAQRSHRYRTLGLGYANLGSLLMSIGLPYDSDEGRSLAAQITAILTGRAYLQSSKIAQMIGPFPDFKYNKSSALNVMRKHWDAALLLTGDYKNDAVAIWQDVFRAVATQGVRNAQVTVLAPTGTIGFMMDCDTTGVEPELALVKYKTMVGGGQMKLVSTTVKMALGYLLYSKEEIDMISKQIAETGSAETSWITESHLPVFDTSFPAFGKTRSIHWQGHLKMMAAVQPFLSGAISKTINMPETCTVEDIKEAYIESWKQNLKCVAIYRDNCKGSQPLSTSPSAKKEESKDFLTKEEVARMIDDAAALKKTVPARRRMPAERNAITHKFVIAGHEGYLTVGLFEDGAPGELFIRMSKEGSTMSGWADSFATLVSISLQYNVPLEDLVKKFKNVRFDPSGFVQHEEIHMAASVVDYIFQWMEWKFLKTKESSSLGFYAVPLIEKLENVETQKQLDRLVSSVFSDAPACTSCGSIMTRGGTCYKCNNCGETSGCS